MLWVVLLVGLTVVVLGAATGGVVGAGVLVGLRWVGRGWCVLFLGSVLDGVDLDRGEEGEQAGKDIRICLPLLLMVVWRRGLGDVEDLA